MKVIYLRQNPLPREYEGVPFRVVVCGQHVHSPDEDRICTTIHEAREAARYLPQDAEIKLVRV